uniref:Uncharacterized protein n=1 Tax=uncultured bacterium A1Q1_fos_75 TaxID=1256589 RepID=L7VW16_9BACT|nr:hypothetical protein [uncultured bacterium A1Q1_fos_75]
MSAGGLMPELGRADTVVGLTRRRSSLVPSTVETECAE